MSSYQPRWLRKQRANREALKNWPARYVLGASNQHQDMSWLRWPGKVVLSE